MRRSHLNRKLEDVRKSLNASESAMYGFEEAGELDVEAERIVSSESGRYILIQGKDVGSSSQEESQEEDDEHSKSPSTHFKGSSTSQISKTSDNARQVSSHLASERRELVTCDLATHHKPLVDFDVTGITSSDSEEEGTAAYSFPTHTGDVSGRVIPLATDSELSSKDNALSSTIVIQDKESDSEELALADRNEKELDAKEDLKEGCSAGLAQEDYQQCHISVAEADSRSFEATSTVKTTDTPVAKAEEKASIIEKDKRMEEEKEVITLAEEQVDLAKEEEMATRLKKVSQLLELPAEAMDSVLNKEIEQLDKDVTQQEKRAAGVTDWMYSDAQVSLYTLHAFDVQECADRSTPPVLMVLLLC